MVGEKRGRKKKNAVHNYPCILIISAMCVRLRGSHASLHPHTICNKPAKSAIASTVAVTVTALRSSVPLGCGLHKRRHRVIKVALMPGNVSLSAGGYTLPNAHGRTMHTASS
jgi:hypothetical protein